MCKGSQHEDKISSVSKSSDCSHMETHLNTFIKIRFCPFINSKSCFMMKHLPAVFAPSVSRLKKSYKVKAEPRSRSYQDVGSRKTMGRKIHLNDNCLFLSVWAVGAGSVCLLHYSLPTARLPMISSITCLPSCLSYLLGSPLKSPEQDLHISTRSLPAYDTLMDTFLGTRLSQPAKFPVCISLCVSP